MKKLNIQNIIVPIDFSQMSMGAIQIASHLARRFGASIHLAHVHQFNYAADFMAPAPPIIPFSFLPYEQDGEQTALKELKRMASKCGVSSANYDVLSGAPPFDEICRLAHAIPADLVVMPTRGRTGLKHVFLGSTAERVVQHSSCPVLVTRGNALQANKGSRFRVKTILVPVDFSNCSREGLRYAIRFANEFGAKLILLHATYLGYIYSTDGTGLYDIPGLQKAARQNAERKMRELVRSVNFGPVKFETAFTEASPLIDICGFAKDHDVDLIITSTHGLTGFRHVLIGSIAEQVVRHAPCSVLVVPSHPHVRAANLTKSGNVKVNRVVSQQQPPNLPGGRAVTRKGRKVPARHRIGNKKRAAFNNCCEATASMLTEYCGMKDLLDSPMPISAVPQPCETAFKLPALKVCLLIQVVIVASALAQTPSEQNSPFPSQAKQVHSLAVPVPKEIFRSLDQFQNANWSVVKRPEIARWKSHGDQAQIATLLGVVIAEGFIAMEAKDSTEVQNLGKNVLSLTRGLGIRDRALRRSRSIMELAEKNEWSKARKEWDGVLSDLQSGMIEIKSGHLAQLVSVGGWLRGTEALSALVLQNYSPERANLIRQPELINYLEQQLHAMSSDIQGRPIVGKLLDGMERIRSLVENENGPPSEETVQKIHAVCTELVTLSSRRLE